MAAKSANAASRKAAEESFARKRTEESISAKI
jgi:hypothetical protein